MLYISSERHEAVLTQVKNSDKYQLMYQLYLVDISTDIFLCSMKAEDKKEILTAAFQKDLGDTLFFQSHRIHKALLRRSNQLMIKAGIDLQLEQFPIIFSLWAMKSASQNDLANTIGRDKASIKRSVTVLESRGLLEIGAHETDKRKNILKLTAKGEQLIQATMEVLRKAESEVLARFTLGEKQEIIATMKSIADKIEQP